MSVATGIGAAYLTSMVGSLAWKTVKSSCTQIGQSVGTAALTAGKHVYNTGVENYGKTYGPQHESQLTQKSAGIAGGIIGKELAGSVGETVGNHAGRAAGYVAGPVVAQSDWGQQGVTTSIKALQSFGSTAFDYVSSATGCKLPESVDLSAGVDWTMYGASLLLVPGYAEKEAICKTLDAAMTGWGLMVDYVQPCLGTYFASEVPTELSPEEVAKVAARQKVKETAAELTSKWVGVKVATEMPPALANAVLGEWTDAGTRTLGRIGAAAAYLPGLYFGAGLAQSTAGKLATRASVIAAEKVTNYAVDSAIDAGLSVYDNYQKGESYLNSAVDTASKATVAASSAMSSLTSYFWGCEAESEEGVSKTALVTVSAENVLTASAELVNSVVVAAPAA